MSAATPSEELKKIRTLIELKESFFDDDDIDADPFDSRRKLWIKPQKSHLNSLKPQNILFEGWMAKKGKKTKLKKLRYYILTRDFLAYKEKEQSTTIKKLMILERTGLEFYKRQKKKDKGPKFGFYFTRNQKCAKVYTRAEEIHNGFKSHLSRLCILCSFIEDYSIVKLIGQGSYGKVYLVRRKSDNALFATKMFQKEVLMSEQKGKASLINEVRILRKMDHPGIVKLHEVHETRVSITLVMELLEGGELFERLDSKKVYSENDCALMLRKILEPLLYMHENDIMHRDIKPENLILRSKSNDFDIVIADFGLAQEGKKKFLHIRCGTPGYCAPEVLSSKAHKPEYDLKVDVFSVGCVFYQMVTGNLPFSAKNVRDMFEANKKCEITFEDPKIQGMSPDAQNLLQLMLSKDSSKRPSLSQCLNHNFFFEANKRASGVVFSFAHQSLGLFGKTFHSSTKDKIDGSMSSEYSSFVVGKPNLMRGHLDTLQEITVVSTAIGVQNMLGMKSLTQSKIQQKLSKKFTTDSRTKLTRSETQIREALEEEEDRVLDSSLTSYANNGTVHELQKENMTFVEEKKRIKVDHNMRNVSSYVHIKNPFQSPQNSSIYQVQKSS